MRKIETKCPRCGITTRTPVDRSFSFLLYNCPGCGNNVVYYDDVVDIVSEDLLKELFKKEYLWTSGGILAVSEESYSNFLSQYPFLSPGENHSKGVLKSPKPLKKSPLSSFSKDPTPKRGSPKWDPNPLNRGVISKDEILNLRIFLETGDISKLS